jgi:GNAT superfamily N-acetyltransferase
VCVRGRLDAVPEVPVPTGFVLRDMDVEDPADVARWLAVHNAAFERRWTAANHRIAMVENPVVVVDRTFLAERDGDVVGTASIGRFRGNLAVGVGHYLAVHPSAQRHGLALALSSHRYRALAERVEVAEAQTHGHRIGSLRVHFQLGFVPKTRIDSWNSLVPRHGPVRWSANRSLRRLYVGWRAGE